MSFSSDQQDCMLLIGILLGGSMPAMMPSRTPLPSGSLTHCRCPPQVENCSLCAYLLPILHLQSEWHLFDGTSMHHSGNRVGKLIGRGFQHNRLSMTAIVYSQVLIFRNSTLKCFMVRGAGLCSNMSLLHLIIMLRAKLDGSTF
jgi:hypothetical protein